MICDKCFAVCQEVPGAYYGECPNCLRLTTQFKNQIWMRSHNDPDYQQVKYETKTGGETEESSTEGVQEVSSVRWWKVLWTRIFSRNKQTKTQKGK